MKEAEAPCACQGRTREKAGNDQAESVSGQERGLSGLCLALRLRTGGVLLYLDPARLRELKEKVAFG